MLLADAFTLRLDSQGRPRILTDRPSLLERTPSTWTNTVLLWNPVAYRRVVQAGAMALDLQDRARVVAVNVGGLRNVVRAASYQSIDRIVYTSSILSLGATDGGIALAERRQRGPQ